MKIYERTSALSAKKSSKFLCKLPETNFSPDSRRRYPLSCIKSQYSFTGFRKTCSQFFINFFVFCAIL